MQAQIQGDKERVTGEKRDDLQEAMALLRKAPVDVPPQFNNVRGSNDGALVMQVHRVDARSTRAILRAFSDVLESSCVGLRLDLPRIYEGVELPPPGVVEEPPEYAAVG